MPQSHLYDNKQFDDDGASGFLNEGEDQRTLREVLTDYIRKFEEDYAEEQRELEKACRSQRFTQEKGDGRELSVCEQRIAGFLDVQLIEEGNCNRQIKDDNKNALTLSTIHHSKVHDMSHTLRCPALT